MGYAIVNRNSSRGLKQKLRSLLEESENIPTRDTDEVQRAVSRTFDQTIRHGNALIYFGAETRTPSDPWGEPVAFIRFSGGKSGHPLVTKETFVREGHRRKGIAEKLIFRLIAHARARGIRKILRPFQSLELVGLAEKMKKNPRMIRSKTGQRKLELVQIEEIDLPATTDVTIRVRQKKGSAWQGFRRKKR